MNTNVVLAVISGALSLAAIAYGAWQTYTDEPQLTAKQKLSRAVQGGLGVWFFVTFGLTALDLLQTSVANRYEVCVDIPLGHLYIQSGSDTKGRCQRILSCLFGMSLKDSNDDFRFGDP